MFDFNTVIPRQGTNCEKWDHCQDVFGTSDLLPMWVADMDFRSPPAVTMELTKRVQHGIYGYTGRGDSLYESITNWMQKRHHWGVQRSWLSFSPGVVPALSACVQTYTKANDKIIIFTPVYTPFFNVITKNGRVPLVSPLIHTLNENNESQFVIDFDQLEKSIDSTTTMMILCSPHNPIGRVWTKEELSHLGQICLKHNIIIVSDEIHHDLVYAPYRHIPIASLSPELEQCTITCTAPSKTFNIAGLTSSLVIIPNKELKQKFDTTMAANSLGEANLFGVSAMEAAYLHGNQWLDELLVYLKENLDFMESFLKQKFPHQEVKLIRPEATYLAWLDFRLFQKEKQMNQKQLCEFLVSKAKIGLSDGLSYSSGKHLEGNGFMRLNFGCPRSLLTEGLNRIVHAIAALK